MREYENIAYIDLQKTGSTTIRNVLADILDEDLVHASGPSPLRADFDPAKLYFISSREPLSLYISLFSFGTGEKKGGLYGTMCRNGHEALFAPSPAAFERWLEFVLDPDNAGSMRRDYGLVAVRELVGFLSYRLMYLSVPKARRLMEETKFATRDDVRALFAHHVYEDYVRMENLGNDLFAFLSRHAGRLKLREELTTAEDLTANLPVKNPSRKIPGLTVDAVSAELRQRVREREWLFYETFGYDADPKGRPPKSLSA